MHLLHTFSEILTSTIGITCLVMVMMLLIEFINVSSSGKALEKLQHKPLLQVVVASLLGLIPGCIGGFTIVSLYTHRLLSFGALVAGMISTFGDSAFLLFAISPKTAPPLLLSLFGVALVAGFVTHVIFKKRPFYTRDNHTLEIHEGHTHEHGRAQLSWNNVKKISFSRAILIFGLVLYLTALGTGAISHEHGSMPDLGQNAKTEAAAAEPHSHHVHCAHHHNAEHQCNETCHHDTHHHGEGEEPHHLHGENIVFGILALLTLVVVIFCSEHFLQEHLWEHVIKHHFLSVFFWTLGVLVVLTVLNHFIDLEQVIAQNQWMTWALLFVALGIGIIPESQPQFVWIYLFATGAIPFSILLASSIVQDGHGALPLLAYSRKSFLMMKAVNIAFGLIVGVLGIMLGF